MKSTNLIMKDKERLLSRDEPLRFIFSHSALREGWDNPNVFQICTLNETKSRDQEAAGDRPRAASAGGSRPASGASTNDQQALRHGQRELRGLRPQARRPRYEEECGVEFKDRIANKRERRKAQLVPNWRLNPDFLALWEKIQHRTRYSVEYASAKLVAQAGEAVRKMPPIEPPKIVAIKTGVMFDRRWR